MARGWRGVVQTTEELPAGLAGRGLSAVTISELCVPTLTIAYR